MNRIRARSDKNAPKIIKSCAKIALFFYIFSISILFSHNFRVVDWGESGLCLLLGLAIYFASCKGQTFCGNQYNQLDVID